MSLIESRLRKTPFGQKTAGAKARVILGPNGTTEVVPFPRPQKSFLQTAGIADLLARRIRNRGN